MNTDTPDEDFDRRYKERERREKRLAISTALLAASIFRVGQMSEPDKRVREAVALADALLSELSK